VKLDGDNNRINAWQSKSWPERRCLGAERRKIFFLVTTGPLAKNPFVVWCFLPQGLEAWVFVAF
jgi:hypothetical protein